MDHDVAIWQHGVQHDQLELGLASHLFETSTAAFSAILNVLSLNPTKFDSVLYGTLRNEFRKFYMWNEGFATQSGGLDDALSVSRNLKATVLKLMVQWARAVCRGDIFPEETSVAECSPLACLRLILKAEQCLEFFRITTGRPLSQSL